MSVTRCIALVVLFVTTAGFVAAGTTTGTKGLDARRQKFQPRLLLRHLDTDTTPAVAIFRRGTIRRPRVDKTRSSTTDTIPVILAVWPDGRILWSKDRLQGGAPYQEARIAPGRLDEVIGKLARQGTFDSEFSAYNFAIPDSEWVEMVVMHEAKFLRVFLDGRFLSGQPCPDMPGRSESGAFCEYVRRVYSVLLELIPEKAEE